MSVAIYRASTSRSCYFTPLLMVFHLPFFFRAFLALLQLRAAVFIASGIAYTIVCVCALLCVCVCVDCFRQRWASVFLLLLLLFRVAQHLKFCTASASPATVSHSCSAPKEKK